MIELIGPAAELPSKGEVRQGLMEVLLDLILVALELLI